ncbi:MAG: sulfotransferase [Pseudomonadota bacterium]
MPGPRYVFIGGLHRSGTSLLAQLLGAHPDIAAIEDAPVPENEGVYLQGAIPHTARSGLPGRFAFDEAQHLTEESRFNTLGVRDYLTAQWDDWYAPDAPWRLEKSPVNLMRARLYQQLFPTAQFVFVTRHPVAVARATMKWTPQPEAELLAHWETAHARLLADLDHLHCWLVMRYEDLTRDPQAALDRIATFLDIAPLTVSQAVDADLNARYFDAGPPSPDAPPLDHAAAFGYAIDDAGRPQVREMPGPRGRHYFNSRTAAIA